MTRVTKRGRYLLCCRKADYKPERRWAQFCPAGRLFRRETCLYQNNGKSDISRQCCQQNIL